MRSVSEVRPLPRGWLAAGVGIVLATCLFAVLAGNGGSGLADAGMLGAAAPGVALAATLAAGYAATQALAGRRWQAAVVASLARALDAHDPTSTGHVQRVGYYAEEVARRLGLPPGEREAVRMAAVLHDVGKMGIPEAILRKPGALTPEEYRVVQEHAEIGGAIVAPLPFGERVGALIRAHHERWDGTGYPDRLRGEEIPLGARIIAAVDVFDALTSHRPYRGAWTREEAVEFLREQAGSHFDPRVVRALLEVEPFCDEDPRHLARARAGML